MNNNNYRCQQCTDECVGMCAKDWQPEEDKYNPENAIVWFGWFVVTVICGLFMRAVLS